MIKYTFLLGFLGISFISFSQSCPALIFTYDVSGNRIQENTGTGCNNNNNNNNNARKAKDASSDSANANSIAGLSAKVYPNPAHGMLNVQVQRNGVPSGDSKIFLYDPAGRLVYSQNTLTDFVQLNISSLAVGTYILKITSKDNQCSYLVSKTE